MDVTQSHSVQVNERSLRWALLLTTTFLVAEVVGGLLAQSLALISDAAHMLTDAAALAIALLAIRIGRRPADNLRTFGYFRFEILAAAFNAGSLFAVAIYILVEAWRRLQQPSQIQSMAMMIIALLGLAVNLISFRLLSAGKQESLNVKGAYLEVLSDLLGSVGVIAGALIIRWTGWSWIDTLVAVAIGLWVVPRTWILLRDSINILLEGVPAGLNYDEIEKALLSAPGVASIHDLHVWAISSGKVSLTAHVVYVNAASDTDVLQKSIRTLLADRFDIHHITIQLEREPCEIAMTNHRYGPKSDDDEHLGHALT